MALRDQPYLPLYIQDIMTDEKLNECCAATHGIYIKGIMCLMHKSEQYGKILLKQKDKQSDNQIQNFAAKIQKHVPYSVTEIEAALFELLAEKVLYIDGDSLCQKRMIEDNRLSEIRAQAGKTGGEATKKVSRKVAKAKMKANRQAKDTANPENEIEVVNEDGIVIVLDQHGKTENYFLGAVPDDIRAMAAELKPVNCSDREFQDFIQTKLTDLGYQVTREAAARYTLDGEYHVDGFADLQASKDTIVVGVELDNRVITKESEAKIKFNYLAGCILLRDPKAENIVATFPATPMVETSTAKVYPFQTQEFIQQWTRWLEYRKKSKKPYKTEMSEKAALKWLGKYDEQTAIEMIEQSILNGYQGLFELKSNGTAKQTIGNKNNSHIIGLAEGFKDRGNSSGT